MILYKCEFYEPTKCNGYTGCECKCTFAPAHVWSNHPAIMELVNARKKITVCCDGCPNGKSECDMEFYKEVPDEGTKRS